MVGNNIDGSVLLDVALSILSTYASIRGTTAPFVAAKDHKSRASSDWVSKLGLTRVSSLYHAVLIILTILQSRKMVQAGEGAVWQTAGARTAFRLTNMVTIAGGVLRVVCFKELGRFFTFDLAVQRDQKVIQTGPYAYVRHPSYTAMVLLMIGSTFSFGVYGPLPSLRWKTQTGWAAMALCLVASSIISLRIGDEERMLRNELGQPYQSYMRRVRYRLIPLLF